MQSGTVDRSFLAGFVARSQIIDCPLWAYEVRVTDCSGAGECAATCMVYVFTTDSAGRCTVANEALCFGCMACVSQCSASGVKEVPREERRHPAVADLLR